MIKAVALIPARAGSKRVVNKNIRKLGDKPLIAHTIIAAQDSKCFDSIIVSTDSEAISEVAYEYGADVIGRPPEFATDTSPDIDWVIHALINLEIDAGVSEFYSILRPTSPFRTKETIQRAINLWEGMASPAGFTSLRAVEKVQQHPAKMWQRLLSGEICPVLLQPSKSKWHDNQYPSLPDVYTQNASLEIASTSMTMSERSISGKKIYGFLTLDNEGFDINTEYDLSYANELLEQELANA